MSRALGLAIACACTPAFGSPGGDPTAGRAVFTGATMPSATSIDLDPAALGIGTIDEIYFSGTLLFDQFGITSRIEDASGNFSRGPHMRDDEFGPGGMIAYVRHIGNDRGTLGLALRTGPTELFFGNHDAERYYLLGGSERTYGGSFAGSVKITDELWFGLSLDVQKAYLHMHYALDTALAQGHGPGGVDSDCGGAPCGIGNPAASERFDVNVSSSLLSASDAIGANIGLVYQLGRDTYLAAAFHAPPGLSIQNELSGTMDVRRAPRDGGFLVRGGSTVFISQPASVDAELRTRPMPGLDLHVGLRWADLSRFAAYDVRGYGSTFPSNGIPEWTERPRGFHDQLAMWAGVEQTEPSESAFRFGARFGFESSGVDNSRTSPMTIAPLSATADLGIQYRLAPGVIVQLTYGLQYFPTVSVAHSAFDPTSQITCMDSGFDYSTTACQAVRNGYALPTAAGDYDRLEHAARLAIRYEIPDVVVYGATGLVGGRVCGDLDDADVAFAVAGRDRGALDKLAGVVAAEEVRIAELDDAAALARAFAGAKVVVNAAGPFAQVLAAALAAKAHYVDLGGDQAFLHAMYERHESTARHAGVAAVPGCALNCAAGDWAAAWAARDVCGEADDEAAVRTAPGPRLAEDHPLDDVAVSYVFDDLVLSPGSQRAVFGGLHAPGLVWRRDRWEAIAPGAERRRINAGAAMGGERDVVSFPGGDVITLPRHLAARQIQTYTSTTRSAVATTALRLLARAMPLLPRRATEALATYTPADDEYARTHFAVVAQARRDFAAAHVVISGSDHYRTSAAIASWAARALLGRTAGPTGMLAPSELFRPTPALREVAALAGLTVAAG